jgi:hypothetical protein
MLGELLKKKADHLSILLLLLLLLFTSRRINQHFCQNYFRGPDITLFFSLPVRTSENYLLKQLIVCMKYSPLVHCNQDTSSALPCSGAVLLYP